MSKNLSAKYYLKIKKITKKTCEGYLSKEEKGNSDTMVVNVTKVSQKIKSKSLLSIEKSCNRMRKYVLL